ncbi:MAG: hypothetical protein ABI162_06820 [Luteolibacter sp.]
MKICQSTEEPTLSSGAQVPIEIGLSDRLEDQQMIMTVLSDSLYTDKIAAVIREYACNAADANVEAGVGDTPIEVRLPNKLEPTLAIRDFGFGMSKEQVIGTFCKMGSSTKRASNEVTGMLGIGSKAGIAYGDSFMVTSYSGKSLVIYNIYREQGQLKLAILHEGPSDAPMGLEVKVPVRQNDIDSFVQTAQRVLRYFRVTPIIQGATCDFSRSGPQYAGTGWRYTGDSSSVAIMGNVGYDLKAPAGSFTSQAETLVSLGVELDFEIGDLEVAANREGLQYKDRTVQAIAARLKTVEQEIAEVFTNEISGASSFWEAKLKYSEVFDRTSTSRYSYRSLKDVVGKKIMWNGIAIGSGTFNLDATDGSIPGVSVKRYSLTSGRRLRSTDYVHDVRPVDVELILNDLPTKTASPNRLRGFFDARVPRGPHNDLVDSAILLTFEDDTAKDAFIKEKKLEGAPMTLFSSIAPVSSSLGGSSSRPASVSAHAAKHHASVVSLRDGLHVNASSNAQSEYWEGQSVDLKKGKGTHVVIDRFLADLGAGNKEMPSSTLLHIVQQCRKGGLLEKDELVYGVKRPQADKVGPGWVNLKDRLETNLKAMAKKPAFLQRVADHNAVVEHNYGFGRYERVVPQVSDRSVLGQYLKAWKFMNRAYQGLGFEWASDYSVAAILSVGTLVLPKPSHDLDAMWKRALHTYPLFPLLCSSYGPKQVSFSDGSPEGQIAVIEEYVKLLRR